MYLPSRKDLPSIGDVWINSSRAGFRELGLLFINIWISLPVHDCLLFPFDGDICIVLCTFAVGILLLFSYSFHFHTLWKLEDNFYSSIRLDRVQIPRRRIRIQVDTIMLVKSSDCNLHAYHELTRVWCSILLNNIPTVKGLKGLRRYDVNSVLIPGRSCELNILLITPLIIRYFIH